MTPVPPATSLTLKVLSPQDGQVIEASAARVIARTAPDAVVAINDSVVDVGVDGLVRSDVVLDEGPNIIEVLASDLSGQEVSSAVVVFYNPSDAEALPFTLLYPVDGQVVDESIIPVVGVTTPDATVAVNDDLVDPNALGIFSTEVSLNEGGNLLEVTVSDLGGNTRYKSVAVFLSQ